MPSCVIKLCKNNSEKQKRRAGLSFHKFPLDPDIRKKWVAIVRQSRQDKKWLPSNFCIICSEHFAEDDTCYTSKGRRCLKKEAEPSQKIFKTSPEASDIHSPKKTCTVEIKFENDSTDDANRSKGNNEVTEEISIDETSYAFVSQNILVEISPIKEETTEEFKNSSVENKPGPSSERMLEAESETKSKDVKSKNLDTELKNKDIVVKNIDAETISIVSDLKNIISSSKNVDSKLNNMEIGPKTKNSKSVTVVTGRVNSDFELNNLFDLQKMDKLKIQLKREQMLRINATRKIKILQQKIRRLTRRNTGLKKIVMMLKHAKQNHNKSKRTEPHLSDSE